MVKFRAYGMEVHAHALSWKVFKNAHPHLSWFFDDCLRRFPDRDFLIHDDQRFTFKQVDDTTNALASQLQETYGIHLGDRVSISMRNYPEWCLAFIADTCMGATAVLRC